MVQLCQAIVVTPLCTLGLIAREQTLCGIDFLPPAVQPVAPDNDFLRQVIEQLQHYFIDPYTPFNIPLTLVGTAFQRQVWERIAAIPCGQTLTYGELAQSLNTSPRAAANACGANPVPLIIPCHRVVAKHGLGGFMRGRGQASLALKQRLLVHEQQHT